MHQDIALDNVRVDFQGHTALEVSSLSIPTQKLIAVVGPNGGAKTTLLRVLIDQVPYKGSVRFPKRGKGSWAYMSQKAVERRSFPLTVLEYIAMSLYKTYGPFKVIDGAGKRRLDEALETVALQKFGERTLDSLSGGEWQRVQLARLFLIEAEYYVLDEPFSAVDRHMVILLQKRLQDLRDRGKTVFVVTHDLVTVQTFFDYAILMRREVVASGPPENVLSAANIEKAYGWMVNTPL